MIANARAKGFVGLIVGLYGLALVAAAGFARCTHHDQAFIAAHTAAAELCLADAAKGDPAHHSHAQSGCGDCIRSESQWIRETQPLRQTHRAEIVTRQDFAARLGRDLDEAPQDTRSRAPPRAV